MAKKPGLQIETAPLKLSMALNIESNINLNGEVIKHKYDTISLGELYIEFNQLEKFTEDFNKFIGKYIPESKKEVKEVEIQDFVVPIPIEQPIPDAVASGGNGGSQ